MKLRAYNLVPGAAIAFEGDAAVVTHVTRDLGCERIHVILRLRYIAEQARATISATFGFNAPVELLGIAVNPRDEDDYDIGI